MERFPLESASDLARNYARSRFAEEIYESEVHAGGHTCENCRRSVDRVTMVPEFAYLACDDCMVEALRVLAREGDAEAIRMLTAAGIAVTGVRKPPKIARQQGELFPGEVA